MTENKRQIRRAGFFVRLAASVIDWPLVLLVATAVFFIWYGGWLLVKHQAISVKKVFEMSELSSEWAQWLEAILELVIYFGYFTYFHAKKGATPGKRLFGLEVVDEITHERLSMLRSLIRTLSYILSAAPFGCGFLMVLFHPRKKALHDLMVGSEVIRR